MCNRARYTYDIAVAILATLRGLGWLRGRWLPVRCRCGGWHLERLKAIQARK